jgi:dynein assembly factor with WDR repeat domains 1
MDSHTNVVYTVAFNNPFGDKILTGSFDKTAKLWSATTGQLLRTFKGHTAEIVCSAFDPNGMLAATGAMDSTARIWDLETGVQMHVLDSHSAEIVALSFNTIGDKLVTGKNNKYIFHFSSV